MGNIQQCCWGETAFRETWQELEVLSLLKGWCALLQVLLLATAPDPESEPWYSEEPQCCPTHAIGAGACAQGAAGHCFSKSSLRLNSRQPKHSLPQELTPGHLCKDREPTAKPIPFMLTVC